MAFSERVETEMIKAKNKQSRTKLLATTAIISIGILLLACNFSVQPLQNQDPVVPTQNPQVNLASIQGYVWDDLCDGAIQEEDINPGCVLHTNSRRVLADGVFDRDEKGIPNIQVSIGNGMCPSRGLEVVESQEDGFYRFDELSAGDYCVSVEFPEYGGLAKPVAGAWTYPTSEDGLGVGWTTVTVREEESRENVNFGWDFFLQSPTQPPSPTNTPEPVIECLNKATFIKDVTVVDGTRFSEGETFNKMWHLKNDGSCTWDREYSFVFNHGDQMNGPDSIGLLQNVPPGEILEVEVPLQAPDEEGSFKGYWMLRSEDGAQFGIGEDADKPIWVQINVGKFSSRETVVSWNYELDLEKLASEGRWIDVDLGQQLLTAYDGSTPIMRFVISSGTASTPTVTGQFRVWVKLSTTDMSGPGYSLEDVPFTMYFYQGYGLHGTFWHDNFGTPMSHGCVNLRTPDASWLFDFASVGTLVNIHP
jgi:hypothetical protein